MHHAWAPPSPTLTRRVGLRNGLAVACGAVLAGCGSASGRRTRPQSAVATVRLVVSLRYSGAASRASVVQSVVTAYLQQHFAARHHGAQVRTTISPSAAAASPGGPTPAQLVAPLLAGAGPDILSGSGYALPAFMDAGLLVPLDPLVQSAGLDLSGFDPGHLHVLRQPPQGLFALPAFDGPDVVLVDYSTIAALGQPAPTAAWTASDAVTLWRHLAGTRAGVHHFGMAFNLQEYFLHLFGGHLMNADGTRCRLDSPLVVQAANWLVPLYQAGVADVVATGAGTDVRRGIATCGMTGGSSLQADLLAMESRRVQWDFLPMPLFPGKRRATANNGDWYAMNARSPNPQALVWELLRFVVTDPGLARLLFRTTFVPPNQRSLWPEWLSAVRAAAPVLRTKHLEAFVQAMDYGVCNHRFRHQPYACDAILQKWIIRIFLGTVSPALALHEACSAIDALQRG